MGLTENQQIAVDCSGRPLFIQAGAGTGKTFTLTKRLAHGLSEESGPQIDSVDNVLTITFTNKAAGELLGRVRAELRAQGLAEAALGIDGAWISTIHSMCQSILSAHALSAKIDPGIGLLTEEESDALLQLAVDEQLGSDEMESLVVAFGPVGACKLVAQLASLLEVSCDGIAAFDLGPEPSEGPRVAMRSMVEGLSAHLASLEELGVRDAPSASCEKQIKRIEDAIQAADGLSGAPELTWEQVAQELSSCAPPKGGNLKKAFRQDFAECLELVARIRVDAATAQARSRLEMALGLASIVSDRHRAMKQSRGVQDTNDLLVRTFELISEHPEVASEYRNRFQSIMVDEFQDTDGLQVRIIESFCDQQLSTLTTVGDLQQSIYGFRGADLETYRSVRAQMSDCGSQEVKLNTNYRSHPDILAFVEAIFSNQSFFGDDFLFIGAGENNAREHAWAPAGSPRVHMLLAAGEKSENGRGATHVGDLRRAEAVMIADKFQQLAANGAEYGQMAILMSSTKQAGPYLEELRSRGIPAAVSGGSDFYLQREVLTMSSLLRVLELPDDDQPMLEVLASPLFDVSDGDLLSLRIIAKRELRNPGLEDIRPKISLWDALGYQVKRLPADPSDTLQNAYTVLSDAMSQLGKCPLHEVVGGVLVSSGWLEELRLGGAAGLAVAANIQRFCDLLADFEADNGPSPVCAAEHFRTMCDMAAEGAGAKGKPGRMVGLGNDAVQVMTIHASKGLEFPIVAVAQYAKVAKSPGSAEAVVLSEGGSRWMALPPVFDGEGKDDLKAAAAAVADELDSFRDALDASRFSGYATRLHVEREEEEAQRLLYVALTRAKDMLLLVSSDSAFSSKGELGKGLFADVVEALFPGGFPSEGGVFKVSTGCTVSCEVKRVPYDASTPSDEEEPAFSDRPNRTHHVLRPRNHARLRNMKMSSVCAIGSYSSLSHKDDGGEQESGAVHVVRGLKDRTPKQETVSVVGSAFHSVAQWIASKAAAGLRHEWPMDLDNRMAAVARRYSLSGDETQRLADAIEAWTNSDRFAQVLEYDQLLPEHPFFTDVEGMHIEGFIDLLCLPSDGSKALAIDYKTGISGVEEELKERYQLQAAVYAYAMLSAKVANEVELVFVRPEADLQEISYSYGTEDILRLGQMMLQQSEHE